MLVVTKDKGKKKDPDKAAAEVLGRLLTVLCDIPDVIEPGELTRIAAEARMELTCRLRDEGWEVTIPGNEVVVKKGKGKK